MFRIILPGFVFFCLISCSDRVVTRFRKSVYWREYNYIDQLEFRQQIRYDRPGLDGEQHSFNLIFTILDSLKLQQAQFINFPEDSTILYCHFYHWNTSSRWDLDEVKVLNVSGRLKLVEWTQNKLVIEEDLSAVHRNKLFYFKGRRTFRNEKD